MDSSARFPAIFNFLTRSETNSFHTVCFQNPNKYFATDDALY